MLGYLGESVKNNETVENNAEGWLRTGDVGFIDEEGNLFITGRLKEIIVTAGGENIPPIPIENKIKEELSCVSNAMVVGDQRKFLSCLLTLKTEVDADTLCPLP